MLVALLLTAAVLLPTAVEARPPGFSSKVAPSLVLREANIKNDAAKKPNLVNDVTAQLQKTVSRMMNGLKSIPKNFLEAERLKKLRKSKGMSALTFSEYGFIVKANDDLSKIFRMIITIPFSPEFFFYSYIVFPAMAPNNPFAWASMSSGESLITYRKYERRHHRKYHTPGVKRLQFHLILTHMHHFYTMHVTCHVFCSAYSLLCCFY
jgi:hypothetical protein